MNNYQTNDIYLASYLIASGFCDLAKITEFDGWKKTFVLSPGPEDRDISAFYSGAATVSALKICNQLRSLKAACQNTKGDRSHD